MRRIDYNTILRERFSPGMTPSALALAATSSRDFQKLNQKRRQGYIDRFFLDLGQQVVFPTWIRTCFQVDRILDGAAIYFRDDQPTVVLRPEPAPVRTKHGYHVPFVFDNEAEFLSALRRASVVRKVPDPSVQGVVVEGLFIPLGVGRISTWDEKKWGCSLFGTIYRSDSI